MKIRFGLSNPLKSKCVGYSTEVIQQSKIKVPLAIPIAKLYSHSRESSF